MEKKTNCLLVKSDIGQTKPTTHDLPRGNHIYGKKSRPDEFGAGSLVSSWNETKQTVVVNVSQDFSKVNKMALKNKVTDAKALKGFRKEVDVKKVDRYDARPKLNKDNTDLVKNTFGKQNRPSTPIKGII